MADLLDVRSLLAQKPTVGGWRQLCAMIDCFEIDERNEVVIPYCRQHLEMTPAWTRLNRRAPKEWVQAFFADLDVTGQLGLVSHIDFGMAVDMREKILAFVTDISPFVMLRVLKLDGIGLNDDHAFALAQAEHFSQLTALHLSKNILGPEGALALASSPHLSGVQNLDLSHNPIGDEGAIAIAESKSLSQLKFLKLEGCGIGKEGAAAISEAEHLPSSIKMAWSREVFENDEQLQENKADWRGGKRRTPGLYRW